MFEVFGAEDGAPLGPGAEMSVAARSWGLPAGALSAPLGRPPPSAPCPVGPGDTAQKGAVLAAAVGPCLGGHQPPGPQREPGWGGLRIVGLGCGAWGQSHTRVPQPSVPSTGRLHGLLPNHSRPQPLWGRVLGCGCGSARAGAPSGRPASLIRCRAFRAGGHCRVCLCFVPFWGPAVLRSQWTMAVSPPSPPEGQSPGLLPAVPPRVTLRAAASWLLFLCGFFHASANVFRTEGPRLSRQRAAPPRPRSRGPGLPAKGAVALACVHRAQVP